MRSSSLPPDLKETPVRRSPMQTAGSLSTPPKVNRVIPLVQCPPTVERVRRNQEHTKLLTDKEVKMTRCM